MNTEGASTNGRFLSTNPEKPIGDFGLNTTTVGYLWQGVVMRCEWLFEGKNDIFLRKTAFILQIR
jgi:hypothetical protein